MNLEIIIENDGTLVPIEFKELPFIPKRMFYVTNVPQYDIRGEHAHFECQQIVICVRGEVLVSLFDGFNTHHKKLKSNQCIYIDKMIWDYYQFMTGDDMVVVLCSTNYDKADYIEDMKEFIKIKKVEKNLDDK